MTLEQLIRIMPHANSGRASFFLPHLNAAMAEFEIDSPTRQAAFLAQIAHESGNLRYVRELASGEAYEGRSDLGNTEPGDGVRFKGRGLIQITGRANYAACGEALGLDLETQPELLETHENACRSAGFFWQEHHLNEVADRGDFARTTKIINGGYNGMAEREAYWERAKAVLA